MHCYVYYWYVLVAIYISSEILFVNSGYLTSGTHYIYVSMDCGSVVIFLKLKGIRQKEMFRKN